MENLHNLDIKSKGSATPLDISSIPGFVPKGKGEINLSKFKVRYLKLDMDNLADIAELEKIETSAIHGTGKYVMNKTTFTFMDKFFIIISFLEEIKD